MLEEYLLNIMKKNENGLYLCEAPTGLGKSYHAAQSIRKYAQDIQCSKKIIYLTTLNKNVDEEAEKIKEAYGDERLFQKEVLVIPSNLNQIVKTIGRVQIPEDAILPPNYVRLKELVQEHEKITQNSGTKKILEEMLSEEEFKFRKFIQNEILYILPKKERLKKIKEDKKYHWIGELYPAVYTDEKKYC